MLIVFEGLDQSGKETQARLLRARLEQDGHHVQSLSFPEYDTPIGTEIRHALNGLRDFTPDVMQLLYVANRLEFKARLEQWLAAGDMVVCDRYCASTIAYGEAQGLDSGWLVEIQRYLPKPDITVLLDISPDTAAGRKAAGRDRYERDLELLARVRESYARQSTGDGWCLIDATAPKEAVAAAVSAAVLPQLSPPSTPARS
jgi:dTMP kinase